jgi:hypothetical protein
MRIFPQNENINKVVKIIKKKTSGKSGTEGPMLEMKC